MILQELHVRVLRPVQVIADGWSDRLTSLDVVAWSAVVSGSSVVCIQDLRSTDEASAGSQAREARVQTALELVDEATVHRGRICACS